VATEQLVDELSELLGSRREARWVVAEVAHLDAGEAPARARAMAQRRQCGEPLQYVFGHWPFRTLDLVVDARALVPRPETEQLVDLALDALDSLETRAAIACDLGCGCGAIALSLASEGLHCVANLEIHATDVDPSALELAAQNARLFDLDTVSFHLGSWYDALPASLRGRMDLVCANPPYVSSTERRTLARELDFEPDLALVSDDGTDGTAGFGDVERVIVGAGEWLAPGGWLFVEHGDRHGVAAANAASRAGLTDVVDHDDLSGRPRILAARRRN
jgi:release factor glutamine methyltransferase